jgi:exonuclease SbcC
LPEGEGTAAEATEALPCWPSVGAAAKDWADARNDLTAKGATLENRGKDQARAQTELSELLSGMSARLAGSVFAGIDDLKAARLAPVDATRTETLENTLTRSANQLDADLRAARASIEKWRMEAAPEGEAVEKLRARQQELQSQHDQLIRDLTIWKKELAQDDTNHQTVADKRKELEADRQKLEIWRRLRGLIGSYDGRTFRRFAQGISLDVLVHYANRHLLRLSDRYRLRRRVGEELELEIEDLHQAGAVRPMASLSGGESFLVSLALALGLSDIAGRNVRIESLFIDEGFGSLDSDTLDLAISALETLRQDNKTVGVISHVDLLKERIATQIIVEKQSGGTSVLRLAS